MLVTSRSLSDGSRNQVSTFVTTASLYEYETIYDQATLTLMEIWDESGHDNTREVGRA